MAPSRYDWKIVDWDVKPQHNQPTKSFYPPTWLAQLNMSDINEPHHDKTNKMSVRPAKTQISLGIHPVWSESSVCA